MLNEAQTYSSLIANGRFGGASQVKIGRKEYRDIIESMYLMAKYSAFLDVANEMEAEKDRDVLFGEVQVSALEAWNSMCKTTHGRKRFITMELEDIMARRGIEEFTL